MSIISFINTTSLVFWYFARNEKGNIVKRFAWKEYIAEFLGTGLMLFIGFSAISMNFGEGSFMVSLIPAFKLRLLFTGILFAGGATLIVYSPIGKTSGGHLNPAVTIAFFMQKKLAGRHVIFYILAQFIGALAGTWLVLQLWRGFAVSVNLGMTMVKPEISIGMAVFLEAVMTCGLVLVIFIFLSVKKLSRFTGLFVGLLVASYVFLEAPLTGTGINPARSFAPAFIMGNLQNIWLYIFAPVLGAVTGFFIYKLLMHRHSPLCGKLFHKQRDPRCIFTDCGY